MRYKKGTNICLYFEKSEETEICKHYGGRKHKLEACRKNCKKMKKRKKDNLLEKYIIGFEKQYEC